jgi:hypothetical protein
MEMWKVVLKNNGSSTVELGRLGLYISAGSQIEISDSYEFYRISGSDDLRAAILNGDLVLNDGVADLSTVNGVAYLTFVQKKYLEDMYYSKAQLGGGGTAEVHWDNITNRPTYGKPEGWYRPALFRVLGMELASPPTGPNTGDVYMDDSNQYFKWDGAAWQNIGTAAAEDRIIDTSTSPEVIYQYSGTSWADAEGGLADGFMIIVNDDGDGGSAQYVYEDNSGEFLKIGDIDFTAHFDGGPSKHDATEIDVEGTYDNIPGTPTDAESAFSGIDTKFGEIQNIVTTRTLDKAYDAGGNGNGRIITADQGPLKIDASSALSAPLELVPKANRSTIGLNHGQFELGTDGILYIYDPVRNKWLSVDRKVMAFGREGKSRHSMYLSYYAGELPSSNSGYPFLRNICITGMAGKLNTSSSCNFHCRKDGQLTDIATLQMSGVSYNRRVDLNYDIDYNSFLQMYIEIPVEVEDPLVVVEYAWRG